MNELTDKERILIRIIEKLSSTQIMLYHNGYSANAFEQKFSTWTDKYIHFAYYDKPKPGDLVLAKTGGMSKYKIGFYIKDIPDGGLIREIGTNNQCNYTNEQFIPIRNLDEIDTLEGDRYQFYIKVLKAFKKGDLYIYRYGGIDFKDDNIATIYIREAFGGLSTEGSQPFSVKIKWDKKTTIKSILEIMRKGGYGTHKFKQNSVQPVNALDCSQTAAHNQ